MGNFYTDVIRLDKRFLSPLPCRDVMLLEPGFRSAIQSIISDAKDMGITIIITETFRSQRLQEHDEAIGVSQVRVGVHHFGLGCDFVRIEDGKADWATRDYQFLGSLADRHGLVWGGDWGIPSNLHEPGFHDWDHVQGCTLDQQSKLYSGLWYPEAKVIS